MPWQDDMQALSAAIAARPQRTMSEQVPPLTGAMYPPPLSGPTRSPTNFSARPISELERLRQLLRNGQITPEDYARAVRGR
jgi:hypothetical protein